MPDLTAQIIKDSCFYTGDLVRIDEEGYLEYIKKKHLSWEPPLVLRFLYWRWKNRSLNILV